MLGVHKHFQATAESVFFLKVSFISSFSCVVEFRGGFSAAPEVIGSIQK